MPLMTQALVGRRLLELSTVSGEAFPEITVVLVVEIDYGLFRLI